VSAPLWKRVQVTASGKVYRPNEGGALVSNKASEEYFRLVRWLLVCSPASRIRLRGKTYEDARQLLNLKNTRYRSG
jgi:hypothetical protein